ncbi:MAG: hypothetical protein Q4F12_02820 [Erysipelotrichaceae bacterium]|nr:hypothetical protein [Erysipelotrichaceae bacterium]
MKKFLLTLLTILMLISLSGCKETKDDEILTNKKVEEIFSRVFDAGSYDSLDYKYAQEYFANTYDKWGKGGCTAVAKVNDAGDTIVGRNMDLTICNKAAYVFRTKVEGCYETINLAYTFRDISPDYEDVLNEGISPEFQKVLPFLADDVLNSEGLYVEVNMRNGETWPTGETKFGCSGTNNGKGERVYLFSLSRYIGEHCANIEEALKYIETLDIYSMYGNETSADNYCFMMADATGRYGLLEVACNNLYWHEGQQGQANFYITEELAKIQELKAGVGRYEYVINGVKDVQTEDEMFNLMNDVTYYQTYFPDICKFDNRSEFVATLKYWTYDYLMNDVNKDDIEVVVGVMGEFLNSMTRDEMRDADFFWESVFTEVINCNNKTLHVRFYEDDTKQLTLSFN